MEKLSLILKTHEGSHGSRESLERLDRAPLQHQTQLCPAGRRHLVCTSPLGYLGEHCSRSGKLQGGL